MLKIKINERLIKFNFSSRNGTQIKYIVIHDTGNISKGANANAHFNYFNTGDRQASAHYFVDDTQILRIIKDENKSWHCGDGKGKYGITNENSIGVELCVNVDADFNKSFDNLVNLTNFLMDKYNIPIENVVRHYDASKKICPNIMKNNNWQLWKDFKNKLINNKNDYTDIIKKLYKSILKRDADDEGLKYWGNKIKNNNDLGGFVVGLFNSTEYKNQS